MVTGFPPYDMPTREDERFDIICHGDLVRQLQAWDSKYIYYFVNNVLTLFLITIFAHTVNSFSIGRGRRSFTVDACPESSR